MTSRKGILTMGAFACLTLALALFFNALVVTGEEEVEGNQAEVLTTYDTVVKAEPVYREPMHEPNKPVEPFFLNESDIDITLSVPSPWKTVDESYFEDAVFIGDSRTQGFHIQSGITKASFLTAKGLMVNTAMSKPVIGSGDSAVTVIDALKRKPYGKVYVMLGINELGWPSEEDFITTYARLVDKIMDRQPDATLYIQSIIYVSEEKSLRDPIYNNGNIRRFNELIQAMAEEKGAVYIDLNEALSDRKGNLHPEASFDGVHLNPDYCKIWYGFLKMRALNDEV